jgi:hypothetical protein
MKSEVFAFEERNDKRTFESNGANADFRAGAHQRLCVLRAPRDGAEARGHDKARCQEAVGEDLER